MAGRLPGLESAARDRAGVVVAQIDLMHEARVYGYAGGLKAIERAAGIRRQPTGKIHDSFYFDADGCFRIVPNSVGLHRPYEGRTPVRVSINSHGFRGPEPKTNAATQIVFVGDSIVFDGGVPDEKTFVRLSEDWLDRSMPGNKRPANCLNLGTTDAGIAQYLAKVKHHALALEPDIIVLGFYLNDSRPPQGFLGEDGYPSAERRLVDSPFYTSRGNQIVADALAPWLKGFISGDPE